MALLDGKVRVGLTPEELERFCAPATAGKVTKVNLQNFEAVLCSGTPGALTVAGSLRVAASAGLQVFCTGGIGGVHRNYSTTHDESSDLAAIARYPVATVCAGIKSILDIPATLERLETLGIPVLGFRAETLPCFFSSSSPYPVTFSTDSMLQLAGIVKTVLASGRGALIVTPVPQDSNIEFAEMEEWVSRAQELATQQNIQGKAVTPFLLKELAELSSGRTLKANLALIQNNARVAAELAVRAPCTSRSRRDSLCRVRCQTRAELCQAGCIASGRTS
jgi:pseudouridine-5'-phosphate glycosidase